MNKGIHTRNKTITEVCTKFKRTDSMTLCAHTDIKFRYKPINKLAFI